MVNNKSLTCTCYTIELMTGINVRAHLYDNLEPIRPRISVTRKKMFNMVRWLNQVSKRKPTVRTKHPYIHFPYVQMYAVWSYKKVCCLVFWTVRFHGFHIQTVIYIFNNNYLFYSQSLNRKVNSTFSRIVISIFLANLLPI